MNLLKHCIVVILILLFRTSFVCAQQTLTLQPGPVSGKDAFLNELYPSTNFGGHPDFISYSWTFNGVEGLGVSLLEFDLSVIPANGIILDARLYLCHNPATFSAGQANSNSCYLRKVTDPWNETTVTWNNAPNTTVSGQVILAKSTLTNQDYPNINVLPFVQDWHNNPASNHGMFLELADKSLYNSMKFCSSDCADSLKRPKLVIKYDLGVGMPRVGRSAPLFSIYPNPANDEVTFVFADQSERSVTIFDAWGRTQISYTPISLQRCSVRLDGWKPGVYYVRSATGTTVEVEKFILK